jgi:hypothetical protein
MFATEVLVYFLIIFCQVVKLILLLAFYCFVRNRTLFNVFRGGRCLCSEMKDENSDKVFIIFLKPFCRNAVAFSYNLKG